MKKFYSLFAAVILAATINAQTTKTITINTTSIGGSSVLGTSSYANGAERAWSQDEVSFGGKAITGNGNNQPSAGNPAGSLIQVQATDGVFYNTTALPGKLVSVTLNSIGTARTYSLQGGKDARLVNSTAGNYTVAGGTVVGSASSTGWTSTDLEGTDYTYFAIKRASSSASYISSIVIVYEEATDCEEPVIVSQPADLDVVVGNPATFTVAATGENLTYKWQAYDEELSEWLFIDYNETDATTSFNIPVTEEWMNGTMFRVVVSSGNCTTISNSVTLTVGPILAVGDVNATKANLVKNTVVSNTIMFAAKADVQILNMNGQIVKTASVNENTSLDVASLAKGMYFVTAIVNGKAVSEKIIKK